MLTAAQAGAKELLEKGTRLRLAHRCRACGRYRTNRRGTGLPCPLLRLVLTLPRRGDIILRTFHDFAALQPGLEPCEIEMDDQVI
jgi:hypothetical protein